MLLSLLSELLLLLLPEKELVLSELLLPEDSELESSEESEPELEVDELEESDE